jgi:hypothetical protein
LNKPSGLRQLAFKWSVAKGLVKCHNDRRLKQARVLILAVSLIESSLVWATDSNGALLLWTI